MRKRVIVITVSILVLLGTYFAVNKLSGTKDEQPSEITPTETISIFKTEKDNISEMTISTPEFEYTFFKEGDSWKVRGKETIKLNNSKVDSLAYDFASINAETVIEDISDLSLYGLDNPAGTPSVKLSDGSVKKFIIGNKTPIGTGYYFKTADSQEVYSVYSSKIEDFIAKLDTYRDSNLTTVDAANLKEIRIKRSDANIILQAKSEEEIKDQTSGLNTWKMISPFKKDASSYNVDEQILKKITGFQVSKFVDDNPSSYAKYGLDNPKYAIGFTEADKEPVTFFLGNVTEDETYVKLENEKAVYTVKTSAFSFKDIAAMDLVDSLVYIQNIEKVNSVTLKVNDETYVLKIVHDGENSTYFVNDTAADESAFKKAYQEAIGLMIRGNVSDMADAQPICTLIFSFNDGRADDIVEAIPYRDRYAAIRVNGKTDYYVMREQVYSMINKIKEFSQNPGKQ